MHRRITVVSAGAVLVLAATAAAQDRRDRNTDRAGNQERNQVRDLPGAEVEIYKQVGDVALKMFVFKPDGWEASDRRPAIVFFFGGGWRSGNPGQFQEHCRYLASRGMVAMAADYRVLSRHGTPAKVCVTDAHSAIRWVRQNAERLGVDPDRIAASGGSAGGHLAACTGIIDEFQESGEDLNVSAQANAMILFNPAVVLASVDGRPAFDEQRIGNLRERMGTDPENLSPYHHVRGDLPPCLIFHGEADSTVAFWTVEVFTEVMKEAGNRCELVGYEGQPHGFFNHGRSGNRYYRDTVYRMDEFLASLGYLEGEPTIERSADRNDDSDR